MKMPLYSVQLTVDEIILLNGKVRPEIQTIIDEAKEAKALEAFVVDAAEARFIAEVMKEARTKGRLICRWVQLHYCYYTGKSAGYDTHRRSGKYYRKGETNFSKPLTMAGIELADRFINVQGYANLGCCWEFWNKVRPKLVIQLENVKAEVAEEITGYPPKWKRFNHYQCDQCGWTGHEGQLLKLPAMFGGYYAGECPNCHAKNMPLLPNIVKTVEGFELVPMG
jgi:hypothetical protein